MPMIIDIWSYCLPVIISFWKRLLL